MEITLASPRGFCAGVVRAIDIVNMCIDKFGTPIYVRHEIVHNPHVVNELKERGEHCLIKKISITHGAKSKNRGVSFR